MEIRPVDVRDDEAFDAFYRVLRQVHLDGREGRPVWSHDEAQTMFAVPEQFATMTAYGAHDGTDLVGIGFTFFTEMDNLDKGDVQVMVPPEHRRRGIGSALVEHLVDVCVQHGRTTVLSEAWVPFERREDHPNRLFAESVGFTVANVELARELPLPVPEEQLASWSTEAAERHPGYTLETFDGPLPDELIESFCDVINQLALDAPTGEVDFEAEALSPDALRQREQKFADAGMTVVTTLAIDSRRHAVAVSTIAVSADDPANVAQWGTIVHRDHRGHRLGLAVKVQNLREVQKAFPERQRVFTCNAEVNAHMVAINEQLGFAPVELLLLLQRNAEAT